MSIKATKTKQLNLPQLSGGLNLSEEPHKIEDNQSSNMLNMWFRERILSKRWGQEFVTLKDGSGNTVTLDGTVHAISSIFYGYVCVHAGTKIYKWNTATNVVSVIASSIANTDSVFGAFNGYLYHIDGSDLRQIDSSFTVKKIGHGADLEPYVPTVYINCAPDFSSNTSEEGYNLIGPGFEVHYNGNGTSTTYTLPVSGLDSDTVVVTIGGVTKTENTHFTVNRTAGTVNFAAGSSPNGAPASGTNNVIIKAYKTISGAKTKVTGSKIIIAFGGESSDLGGGTRCFVMKNASYPNGYVRSDLGGGNGYGMLYFPDNAYEQLIQNNDAIVAAGKQSSNLIIFKERSCFAISYEFDNQVVYYPQREFNAAIGCDIPGSVQLIDNHLVFANTYGGVFMIVNTAGTDEENIKPISSNINGTTNRPGLMSEAVSDLKAASSIDYDRKYWLCVGDKVYLWDYDLQTFYGYADYSKAQNRLVWFKFSNIQASNWYGDTNSLFYSSGSNIAHFIPDFTDFGSAIEAWWYSKAFDFKVPNYLKTIQEVYPSLKTNTHSAAKITLINEENDKFFEKTIIVDTFNWAHFDWSMFSWGVNKFSEPTRLKVKMKKIVYCQIAFYDNTALRDMGISDIAIIYFVSRKVK